MTATPPGPPQDRSFLQRFAWLSIAAAIATIALKLLAWRLTGSVGLLSDALESVVNLVAAAMTLWMLTLASRPPDDAHAYGYSKAEFFSSGFEGMMIFAAALAIGWAATDRLLHPQPIESVGVGLAVSLVASAINFGVARVLLTASKRHGSIALEADAHHLMTDVWTSAGVVVAVAAVALTGWDRLDPLVAIAVAINIVFTGYSLMRRSALGLLDRAISPDAQARLDAVLAKYRGDEVSFHALRTRDAGGRSFVSVHVLVPGGWSVQRGHDLIEQIERDVHAALPGVTLFSHLEPREDPASYLDEPLDRSL
jgi:cation diffusion facilitator family transporter